MSYTSHADLGGQRGHGRVLPEAEGELFHAAWEPRALALTLAMGACGLWNIDASRAARETLPEYANLSYYQIWLAALERLLLERHLVEADELATGRLQHAPLPVPRVLARDAVAPVLARGSPTQRNATAPARFVVGDAVRTRSGSPDHHTRLPAYVRGKRGVITRVHGTHVFADRHAHGRGEQPQWLYTVAFAATELWGGDGRSGDRISVDAWEPYLERA
jgi:nitrile hydratase